MVEVRTAPSDEVEAVTQTLTLAFSTDPVMRWMFPSGARYLGCFPAMARGNVEQACTHDSVWRAEGFRGAAVWVPPGVHIEVEGLGHRLAEHIPTELHADAFGLFGQMLERHPKEPHWYLPMIGVDPAHQGDGVGSALLRSALARVDADGLPAYLESSSPANVPLYQRYGFEVKAELRVGTSPPMILMRRPVP